MTAGSKAHLPLAKSEPINDRGMASGMIDLRSSEKTQQQLQLCTDGGIQYMMQTEPKMFSIP